MDKLKKKMSERQKWMKEKKGKGMNIFQLKCKSFGLIIMSNPQSYEHRRRFGVNAILLNLLSEVHMIYQITSCDVIKFATKF
jgi:hypothetical protein